MQAHSYEKLIAEGTIALAVVTAVLALGTIVLAFFTYKLWKATNTLATDARDAASAQAAKMEASLKIANKAADAATMGAAATEASVAAMSATAERQLRAYVFPELDGKVEFGAKNETPHFQLRIRNSGNTPASTVLVRVQRFTSDFPLKAALPELTEPDVLSSQFIGPESHIFWPSKPEVMSPAEVAIHAGGGFAHYYKGDIRYVDAFGNPRTTAFLLWIFGDTLAGYPEGNSWT